MTREEKNKLAQIVSFELCPNRKYCITNYGEKANCYSDNNFAECSTIMKVADNLIKHETDLLKEFVDYCKKDVEHGNEEAKATIHCWLNLLLEQFLEERKDDERKDN